jgi:hypothetical protein
MPENVVKLNIPFPIEQMGYMIDLKADEPIRTTYDAVE